MLAGSVRISHLLPGTRFSKRKNAAWGVEERQRDSRTFTSSRSIIWHPPPPCPPLHSTHPLLGQRSSTTLFCEATLRSSIWPWTSSSSTMKTGLTSGPGFWRNSGGVKICTRGDSSSKWTEDSGTVSRAASGTEQSKELWLPGFKKKKKF